MRLLVQLFPIVFLVLILAVGALVIGGIVYAVVKNLSRKTISSQSAPELTTAAAVVTKREQHGSSIYHPASSQYFVTFQFPSKDRMEFQVSSENFGMLVEGDVGRLTFRGTQYIRFEREL